MKKHLLWLTVILLWCIAVTGLFSTPTIGTTTVFPNAISVGTPTTVIVTSSISDPSLIVSSVNLLRINANGTSTIIAQLRDDGANGDAVAGDKIFTSRVTLNEASTGKIRLQVSAAFKGLLKRIISPTITVAVVVAATVIGPTGGTLSVQDPISSIYGAAVLVPPGALPSDFVFFINGPSPSPIADTSNLPVGPAIDFSPSDITLSQPITLSIPYNDSDNDGILDGTDKPETEVTILTSSDLTHWTVAPIASLDTLANRVLITVSHLSTFVPVASQCPSCLKWNMISQECCSDKPGSWKYEINTLPSQVSFQNSSISNIAQQSEDGNIVDIWTRANSTDRTKIRTVNSYGEGLYTWRVYVPNIVPGSAASIGAFLFSPNNDSACFEQHLNCKELDFEIGYGKVVDRIANFAFADDDLLCFMTNQQPWPFFTPLSRKVITLKAGQWYTLQIAVKTTGLGMTIASWYVNGVPRFAAPLNYTSPFLAFCSVENLDFIGDIYPPLHDLHGNFDSISYRGVGSCGPSLSALTLPSYNYGIKPTVRSLNDLMKAYSCFKGFYFRSEGTRDPATQLRVLWDDGETLESRTQTVSEGMGYGMLMAAYLETDDNVFNKLWSYVKDHLNEHGLMQWHIDANGQAIGNGSAADADLDIALALIQAEQRWPGRYRQDARSYLQNILLYEIDSCDQVMPGDAFGGCQGFNNDYRTNPSYFATGFMPAFNGGEPRWASIRNSSYTLLDSINSSLHYELVPNWIYAGDKGIHRKGEYYPSSTVGCKGCGDLFGYDAARVPWRLALDYLWHGDARAKLWSEKFATFFAAGGISQIGDAYVASTGTKIGANQGAAFVGSIGCAAMAAGDQTLVNDAYAYLANASSQDYYNDALKVLYLATMTSVILEPRPLSSGIDGLIGYWKLNGDASDSSGFDNNGNVMYKSSAYNAFEAARVGLGISSTAGGYVEVSDSPTLSAIGKDLTVEAWVYLKSYPCCDLPGYYSVFAPIVNKWGPSGRNDDEFLFVIDSNRKLTAAVSGNIGSDPWRDVVIRSLADVQLNTWTHVAMVLDNTAGTLSLFINGIEDSHLSTSLVASRDTNMPLRIGMGWFDSAGRLSFDGLIDEVRIWNVARTPENVSYDINGDGSVDAIDLQILSNVILGVSACPGNCDLNRDGSVNSIDLQLLINAIMG